MFRQGFSILRKILYVCSTIMQSGLRNIIIAIDGYSSCGKSTLAGALAKRLQYVHIDSGAMYRAITLYFKRYSINHLDVVQVTEALRNISIHLSFENEA